MDYKEADSKLQGRNQQSRKLARNTWLQRRDRYGKQYIAVKLHDTDILEFHPDGSLCLNNGGFPTCTTHERLNRFLPAGYRVSGEPVARRSHFLEDAAGSGMSVLQHYKSGQSNQKWYWKVLAEVLLSNRCASITPEGKLVGGDVAAYREERKREQNEARRPANRARYWVRRARGIFVDKSGCTANRWACSAHGRWNRRQNLTLAAGETENTLKCGCRVFQKMAAPGRLTVDKIMAEDNQTVRAAMMKVFGVERFFLEAKPEVLDVHGDEYQLLSLTFNRWNHVRALKMRCSSTGVVYVATVPPHTASVPQALDWIFETEDYLGRVAQAS